MTNPEVKTNYNKIRKPKSSDLKSIIKEQGQWHLFVIEDGDLKNLKFVNLLSADHKGETVLCDVDHSNYLCINV